MKSKSMDGSICANIGNVSALRSEANTESNPSLLGIQYLRGIAALMVAYFHLGIQMPIYSAWIKGYFAGSLNLAAGVDIFFVVSGFIMVISSTADTPWKFLEKRLIRIAPLYWIITLFIVAGYFAAPSLFRTTVVTSEYLAKSLLFIPYNNPGHEGDIVPILVPGWSLNFEMAFYIVFAASLFFPSRIRVMLVGLFFIFLLALKNYELQDSSWVSVKFYLQPRLMEFWLGMLIGEFARLGYLGKIDFRIYYALLIMSGISLLVPVSFFSTIDSDWLSEIVVLVSSALIVLCVVGLEKHKRILKVVWLKIIGDISYSVYLSHILSFGIIRAIWVRLSLDHGGIYDAVLFVVVSMAAVIFVGWVLFSYIEKPLLKYMKNMFSFKKCVTQI